MWAGLWLSVLASRASAAPARLAVVVSADGGASTDVPLLYANTDGDRVADVLTDLGGVEPDHLYRVPDATVESVTQALGRAVIRASAARDAGDEVSLLVYYTGHAGSDGLHLGDEVLPLASLKTAARVVPAVDRVFVVDACQAGQILRSKGATLVQVDDAPTDFTPPPDEAWIASTGPEENAFEVDRRRGALFTHFFVSGARGAADADGDGEVHLDELYSFVHQQTSAAAAGLGYVQQPRWAGTLGDWVVADLDRAGSGLEAVGPVAEPLLIVDRRDGEVAAEIPVGAGGRLALPAGRYQVLALRPGAGRVRVADVVIPADGYRSVASDELALTRGVRTKGGLVDVHPWSLAAGWTGSWGGVPGVAPMHSGWLRVHRALGRGHHLGVQGEAGGAQLASDRLSGFDRVLGGRVQWRHDVWWRGVRVGPAAEVGVAWLHQESARQPHTVWGAWYGSDAAPAAVDVPVVQTSAGLGWMVPTGPLALTGTFAAGPSWTLGSPASVAPTVTVRVGVEVPL